MTKGVINQALGEYVRTRRTSQNLSFNECAEHSGLHHTFWRKLEAGEYESPSPKNLHLVAETISCPIEDLYALCGYPVSTEMPSLVPYLRTKYDLPPEAISDMERYFAQLRSYYGIPDDQPVFPPPPKRPPSDQTRRPSKHARNPANHPWRGSAA